RMDAAGVRPEQVRTPDDLCRLPVLTREEAQTSTGERSATIPPLPTIHKSTSGTLGKPLRFAYDVGSEHWRQAVRLRGYWWAGYRPGARALHYWAPPATPPPALRRLKIALDRLARREHYVDCTVRGDAELLRVVEGIRRLRPEVLVCFTQAGVDLARFITER